jgi:hypothetical protein
VERLWEGLCRKGRGVNLLSGGIPVVLEHPPRPLAAEPSLPDAPRRMELPDNPLSSLSVPKNEKKDPDPSVLYIYRSAQRRYRIFFSCTLIYTLGAFYLSVSIFTGFGWGWIGDTSRLVSPEKFEKHNHQGSKHNQETQLLGWVGWFLQRGRLCVRMGGAPDLPSR